MAFLDADGIAALGLASVGADVRIDADARLIGAARIHVGSHVRIDAFAVLSAGAGGIRIGDHVHVAAHVFAAGAAPIELADFSGLSGRTSLYSSTDDFTGESLTGPTIPDDLRRVSSGPVRVGRHVIVGSGAVILPGVEIHDGAAVGAQTLVRKDVPPFAVVAGSPARVIGERSRRLLDLERELAARRTAQEEER